MSFDHLSSYSVEFDIFLLIYLFISPPKTLSLQLFFNFGTFLRNRSFPLQALAFRGAGDEPPHRFALAGSHLSS
ncbi:hypothetical protein B4102_0851 [Heyndrickxia sporothermodurans]|uniref:Uncharacterized protein n=1 Tax=Heyndrickxia sporothermodurans TaxID=46224 RepID=A0A150KNV7_9BACI|nr:hypothetical protein B4102_0851 [Heyndrickxia sporothermodurans]